MHMNFVQNLGDTSYIPQFAIGGLARAEIIDRSVIGVTFHKPYAETAGGLVLPVCEFVWTIPAWIAARAQQQKIANELVRIGLIEISERYGLRDVALLAH